LNYDATGATAVNHDSLTGFASNEHFTQANITTVGTITSGVWNAGAVTSSGTITANGGVETDTNSKVVQKGAFMQSSTHQALTLGY
jgi:hypothetical protein